MEEKDISETKEELLGMLSQMINSYENLPINAMLEPVTHYDLCSLMMLLKAILSK